MTLIFRTSALVVIVAAVVQPVDISTAAVDNTRQRRNRLETVLRVASVPKLHNIREFIVDDKIDVTASAQRGAESKRLHPSEGESMTRESNRKSKLPQHSATS